VGPALLLASKTTLALLPDKAELDDAIKCWRGGGFLDFTAWTSPAGLLPRCRTRCVTLSTETEVIGKEVRQGGKDAFDKMGGSVPSCVWRRKAENPVLRLRFVLRMTCRQLDCQFLGRWHVQYQMVSIKIAQLLGVPLSEVRSAFLYWVAQQLPEPKGAPRLASFHILRSDEASGVARAGGGHATRRLNVFSSGDQTPRRLDSFFPGRMTTTTTGADAWYVLHLAVRVDTSRITAKNRGVRLFERNDPSELERHLGVRAEVQHFELVPGVASWEETAAFQHANYRPVFLFEGFGMDETPASMAQREIGGVAGPKGPQVRTCLHSCHMAHEPGNQLGYGRCATDCDCNGERWCSHLGECVGETIPCRTDAQPVPVGIGDGGFVAGRTTSTSLRRAWVTTTTFTATDHFSQLTRDCRAAVVQAWTHCNSQAACSLACSIVRTTAGAPGCKQDLCYGREFLDRYLDLCQSDPTARKAYQEQALSCNGAPNSQAPGGSTSEAEQSIAGHIALMLVWILLAAIACCVSMVCLRVAYQWSSNPRDPPPAVRRTVAWVRNWPVVLRWSQKSRVVLPEGGGQKKTPAPSSTEKQKGWPGPTIYKARTSAATSDPSTPGDRGRRYAWEGEGPAAATPSKTGGPARKMQGRRNHTMPDLKAAQSHKSGPASPDSEDSPDSSNPISQKALSKELRQVQSVASKEQLLRITSPKQLRKELHRNKDVALIAERRRIFKELLLKWHPDKNAGNEQHAAEMFQALQECKDFFLADE